MVSHVLCSQRALLGRLEICLLRQDAWRRSEGVEGCLTSVTPQLDRPAPCVESNASQSFASTRSLRETTSHDSVARHLVLARSRAD